MKAALLISGYLRTFSENLPLLKKSIMNRFDEVDIYIHITKNEDIEDKYINNKNDLDYINKTLNPVCLLFEDNKILSDNKNINNLLNNWIKFYRLNEIKKENESIKGKYDIVIKYRPDLNILSEEIFMGDLSKDIVYIPFETKIDKSKLLKKNDNYICDIFSYGNSKIMDKYFEIYENIQNLIEKYGSVSETLLYQYLVDFDIDYKLLPIEYNVILSKCNIFAIAGDSGSGKTTLGKLLKKYFDNSFMLECDRYHKWERGNENWQNLTHLNPDANYITKMNNDIFDLKIGKSIYQVDYDHKSGRFTEKEKIDSSDNLIVCGLHSLYSNEGLYNLKIFMDTDNDLKIKWKIQRDKKERGHTEEVILKQIKNRQKDYIKYIYPQKYKSDIVINFFPIDDKIGLKLFVRKKYNLEKIIKILNAKNINFMFKEEEIFNTFKFCEFQESNFWDNNSIPTFNDFYDYILFFILNLK